MLKLYTKDKCFYCKNLKKNLDKWGIEYQEINISHDDDALVWFHYQGHKTVPQLYYNNTDVQRGESTALTKQVLSDRIERVIWPNLDSGIE